jgi:hypothetical protein
MKLNATYIALRGLASAVALTAAIASAASAQKLTVPGSRDVDGGRIRIGTEKFKMVGKMHGTEREMGTLTQTTSVITVNGKPALRVIQSVEGPIGKSVDTAVAMLKSLQPVSLRGYNEGGLIMLDFRGAKVTGQQRPAGGTPQPINQTFKQPLFDSNMLDYIVAALPLKIGYEANFPVYAFEEGGQLTFNVKVQGERVYDGVRCFDVVVTMPTGEMHYAMSTKDHVQMRAWYKGKNGLETTSTRLTN